jgi:hypothetical protein
VDPDAFVEVGGVEGADVAVAGDHVGLELDDAKLVLAEVEVGLAVVVEEDAGVDGAGAGFVAGDEGVAEGVVKGAGWFVGDGDADLVVGGEVEVIFAVAGGGVGRPGVLFGPGDVGEREDDAVVGPGAEVGGGEGVPVGHVPAVAAGDVVAGVDPEFVAEDAGGGVGLEVGEDGFLGGEGGG